MTATVPPAAENLLQVRGSYEGKKKKIHSCHLPHQVLKGGGGDDDDNNQRAESLAARPRNVEKKKKKNNQNGPPFAADCRATTTTTSHDNDDSCIHMRVDDLSFCRQPRAENWFHDHSGGRANFHRVCLCNNIASYGDAQLGKLGEKM
jgi:hypothetical protein